MIEIERKFRISRTDKIDARLVKMGYQKNESVHQVDTVYLLKSDSFRTFKTGDPVVRIRTANGRASLAYKRVINPAGDTIEHELNIDPVMAAEGVVFEMGYKPVTKVDKMRTEYARGDITIAVDDVKGLGRFAEIEIVCREGQEEGVEQRIMDAASRLELNQDDIEPKKYDLLISELGI